MTFVQLMLIYSWNTCSSKKLLGGNTKILKVYIFLRIASEKMIVSPDFNYSFINFFDVDNSHAII